MTTRSKTKVRMTQQYQRPAYVKQVEKETLKPFRDGDKSVCSNCRNKQYMSTEWNVLPFAFPEQENNLPKSKTINEILTLSLKQQKKDQVFDCMSTSFVTIVVSRCLDAMEIVHKLDCGYRCIKERILPHMWLVIDGYIIDNTYTPDIKKSSLEYICKNTPTCYKSCEDMKCLFFDEFYQQEMRNINLKPQTTTDTFKSIQCSEVKRLFHLYTRQPDKALAIALNKEQSFNYYFSIKRLMYSKLLVSVSGIDPKIRCVCWNCGCYPKSGLPFLSDIVKPDDFKENDTPFKATWKFPHCSRCMVANYCSAECQKADWLDNHRINCFPRGS